MERKSIRIRGIVQGVGFRPFVAVGAKRYDLTGHVYNDSEGVYIEVEGTTEHIGAFLTYLHEELPPLAYVQDMEVEILEVKGTENFIITQSPQGGVRNTLISPDMAPCQACLDDMKNPNNRRYQYGFTNCTNCGPRYTIVQDIPYDRATTTMHKFSMCNDCANEYKNIESRRYHAQPSACSDCGPSYTLLDGKGNHVSLQSCLDNLPEKLQQDLQTDIEKGGLYSESILCAAALVRAGYIVAIKGIGGYHLACDAYQTDSVKSLRERKKRPDKPFALMAGSIEAIQKVAHVNEEEFTWLNKPSRPIVVLERKNRVSPSEFVAPANHYLGIMLGYAPIHYVLLKPDDLWVMTSGNRSGQPVLFDDAQAIDELQDIADFFLIHNRDIEAPVDDSVLTIIDDSPLFFRRSRGFVPTPFYIKGLPDTKKGISFLATGGDLKNAFALSKGKQIFLGPHIGDLENKATHDTFIWTIEHYKKIFATQPNAVIADQHPAYFSTQYAEKLGIPIVKIQHHHAHISAVMAEYNISDTVLGIALDGTGYGSDGHAWGSEFLLASPTDFRRLVHFEYEPLPGGEAAVKEPWRQALWYLQKIYGEKIPSYWEAWMKDIPGDYELLLRAIHHRLPMMKSCGAGRLFDAVGSLLGLGYCHSFDSQIAMSLEQLAFGEKGKIYEFSYDEGIVDFSPTIELLLNDLSKGVSRRFLAASFHRTLAYAVVEVARDLQRQYGVQKVVLGGGVWQNRRLVQDVKQFWPEQELLLPRWLPPSDGGLALGQMWIGSHQLAKNAILY